MWLECKCILYDLSRWVSDTSAATDGGGVGGYAAEALRERACVQEAGRLEGRRERGWDVFMIGFDGRGRGGVLEMGQLNAWRGGGGGLSLMSLTFLRMTMAARSGHAQSVSSI